jgi:ATP-dependent protease ClpP protease subunit
MTKYLLSFNGMIYEKQTNALRDRIATVFEQKDYESLTVLFSSEGGSSIQGLSLYNFLRTLPRPIQFHAMGSVNSMAVPVFCGARKRTCATLARFSFHTYDYGFDGRQTYDRIIEAFQQLGADIELSRKIVGDNTKIPADRLATLYRPAVEPTIFDAQQAKEFGLVEDIVEINPTGSAQEGVALWTVNWPSP